MHATVQGIPNLVFQGMMITNIPFTEYVHVSKLYVKNVL